jgi:hypothetical protein
MLSRYGILEMVNKIFGDGNGMLRFYEWNSRALHR